jgi:uncharacterized protein (TIGR00730 family)
MPHERDPFRTPRILRRMAETPKPGRTDRPVGDRSRSDDQKLLMPEPYADTAFLESDAWRALRIMGEFIEGFDALARLGPAVSIFGSARTARGEREYRQARRLGRRLAEEGFTVITGGGPGVMEAANRGAKEADGVSVGLGIDLPHEQEVNGYVDMAVYHRYFFVRKTMFVKYAQAFVIFPGGFGTLDELFESLTLVQTGKIDHFPIVLVGREFWAGLLGWLRGPVANERKIDPPDLDLLRISDDMDEVVSIITTAFRESRAADGRGATGPATT